MKVYPRPNGELQGDSKAMPDKGTGTGSVKHDNQANGASLDVNATNSRSMSKSDTKSDEMFRNMPHKSIG